MRLACVTGMTFSGTLMSALQVEAGCSWLPGSLVGSPLTLITLTARYFSNASRKATIHLLRLPCLPAS